MNPTRSYCLVILIFCFLFNSYQTFSQTSFLPALDTILQNEKNAGNIKFYTISGRLYISHQENNRNEEVRNLTHFKGKFYLNTNGTGKVFTLDQNNKLIRIDSTYYNGITFGGFFTHFRDTLLLLGGYGFWDTHGALRFYSKKFNQWDVYRTNKDIRFASGINAQIFEDVIHHKIYIIYHNVNPEYMYTRIQDHLYVQCLDLNTKEWWNEPKMLNPKIAVKFEDLKEFAYSSNGIILRTIYNNKVLLLDFSKNKCYSIHDDLLSEIIQTKNSEVDYISFSSLDHYNVFSLKNNSLHRFKLNRKDLQETELQVYTELPIKWANHINTFLAIILLISALIIVYLIYQNKKNKYLISTDNTVHHPHENNSIIIKLEDLFEPQEKSLIKKIISNQKKYQKNTSIEEINEILDIQKRPLKIQNNIRAEAIFNINKKFSVYSTTNDALIERVRSNFDKRFFEYKINKKYSNTFDAL